MRKKILLTAAVLFLGSILLSSCNTRHDGCPAYGNSGVSIKHVGRSL